MSQLQALKAATLSAVPVKAPKPVQKHLGHATDRLPQPIKEQAAKLKEVKLDDIKDLPGKAKDLTLDDLKDNVMEARDKALKMDVKFPLPGKRDKDSDKNIFNFDDGGAKVPGGWGNIDPLVHGARISPKTRSKELSYFYAMWFIILMPLIVPIAMLGGKNQQVFVLLAVGMPGLAHFSSYGYTVSGHLPHLLFNHFCFGLATLLALVNQSRSRLGLFMWEWKAFGAGRYFFHGEGLFIKGYWDCDRVCRGQQNRANMFGAMEALVPEIFASDILIFLPNTGRDSEWAAIRGALHIHFLDQCCMLYRNRMNALPARLMDGYKGLRTQDLGNAKLLRRMVVKSVFWVVFGVWVEDNDAGALTDWRNLAKEFVLPELIHRVKCDRGIKKIQHLRKETSRVVSKYGIHRQMEKMNKSLPSQYQRPSVTKLADEVMYIFGFAGIGGTGACVESVASFLQAKIPSEITAKDIKFGAYDTPEKMDAKYREDTVAYIREVGRMDPPVTSATDVLKVDQTIKMAGRSLKFPKGISHQYVIALANRDPEVFAQPEVFDPDRGNLGRTLTWNGAFGAEDEGDYPRICPGRYLSLDICQSVINQIIGHKSPLMAETIRLAEAERWAEEDHREEHRKDPTHYQQKQHRRQSENDGHHHHHHHH